MFQSGWCPEAEQFAPAVIAGTWPQLQELMDLALNPPSRAVIVLARPGEALLATEDRDRLWRGFRVPVFEQIIGWGGELLASECEAHDGLHLESEEFDASAYGLDRTPCACGQKSPRLIPADVAERVRAVAAYAR